MERGQRIGIMDKGFEKRDWVKGMVSKGSGIRDRAREMGFNKERNKVVGSRLSIQVKRSRIRDSRVKISDNGIWV